MTQIGIVAGGPQDTILPLACYQESIDYWIGCDRGSLYLIESQLPLHLAIGDFDSVDQDEFNSITRQAGEVSVHPIDKDLTDLELAINQAIKMNVKDLFLFGVTGGRKDHELAALFILEQLAETKINATIVDAQNLIKVYQPGKHKIDYNKRYPKISFLSMTKEVTELSLMDFYYPLKKQTIKRGQSLTLSNHLIKQSGYFLFDSGILIVIKSSEQFKS